MNTTRKVHFWQHLDDAERDTLLQRPSIADNAAVSAGVADIIERVRVAGDSALSELTQELDHVELADIRVTDAEFVAAERALGSDAISAIDTSIANVRCFHEAQMPAPIDVETMPGVRCERVSRPIDSVGLYVPAGTAPLPSAAVMLAVPASIAGCRRKILCTPPRADGNADPSVLVAAARSGITEVCKVGGAQAIAALAYGTQSVHRVDKIFGPGNAWVTEAKSRVSGKPGGVAIDMPAGPSEVLVIADADANPAFVAADLLAQAEHGTDSQVLLLTTCANVAEKVRIAIDEQLAALDRREIVQEALQYSRLIVCESLQSAIDISNIYAPEHLILQVREPRRWLPTVHNAGSVFLGAYSPESVGDYCSGTNHVLPTYGAARNYSGLGVDQFMRHMTVQELSVDGLRGLAAAVTELARLEGLDAHAAAVTIRLARGIGAPS